MTRMLTRREKTLIVITFCLTFAFALIVLTYPLTEFLIISLVVKNS